MLIDLISNYFNQQINLIKSINTRKLVTGKKSKSSSSKKIVLGS